MLAQILPQGSCCEEESPDLPGIRASEYFAQHEDDDMMHWRLWKCAPIMMMTPMLAVN